MLSDICGTSEVVEEMLIENFVDDHINLCEVLLVILQISYRANYLACA